MLGVFTDGITPPKCEATLSSTTKRIFMKLKTFKKNPLVLVLYSLFLQKPSLALKRHQDFPLNHVLLLTFKRTNQSRHPRKHAIPYRRKKLHHTAEKTNKKKKRRDSPKDGLLWNIEDRRFFFFFFSEKTRI